MIRRLLDLCSVAALCVIGGTAVGAFGPFGLVVLVPCLTYAFAIWTEGETRLENRSRGADTPGSTTHREVAP